MREPDSLDALLREWKPPAPAAELDQRVISSYRSAIRSQRVSSRTWRHFWTMRVSIPAPVLVVAAIAALILVVWLRPSAAPVPSPAQFDAVTRLNASGFEPLPNGQARVIPAAEVKTKEVNK